MTGITRAYSKSHFDHVAMCLKFETDPSEIFLIEATGNYGVGINRWSSLKEFIGPTGHNADVPFVVNKEYTIINVEEEDVACVDPEGLEVNGVVLPIHDGDLAKKIQAAWDKLQESGEEKELIIMVTHAMGEFHITSMKERNL